jgi:signal transduction histidine kinase/HAMP domain-containing protein
MGRNTIYSTIEHQRNTYVKAVSTVSIVLILFSLLISFTMLKRFGIEIEKILNSVSEYRDGTFENLIPVESYNKDEIGELQVGINAMAENIQKQNLEQQQITSSLETIVAENRSLVSILEMTTDLVVTFNLKGKILYMNDAGRKLLCVNSITVSEMNFYDCFAEEEQSRISDGIELIEKSNTWSTEARIKTYDDQATNISGLFIKHSGDNEQIYSVVGRDLSVVLESEKELITAKAKEKAAQEANEGKSIFLANISHDIRTPMHGILSFSNFGMRKIKTATPEKLFGYFKQINVTGNQLLSLLNDLLDITKMESGKMSYSIKENDIYSTISAVYSEFHAMTLERELEFECDFSRDSVMANYDSDKVMQVLRNLVSNAIMHTVSRGKISIIVNEDNDDVCVEVINDSDGIKSDNIESIFQPFVQGDSRATEHQGTGLGLPISKQIIRDHCGKIWVENLDHRVKFSFTLPRSKDGGK